MELDARAPAGLICPLVTPLDPDYNLDAVSFRRLWSHVERWVDGLLIGDPLWGEGPFLSSKLRLALIENALDLVGGKGALLIGITSPSLEETVQFRRGAEAIIRRRNYHGPLFWVDYPLYYHSNRGLPDAYASLLSETAFPLLIGNDAQLVKMKKRHGRRKNIRTRVLKKIASLSSVIGIIYAGDLQRALNYHMAVRFRDHFLFYDGDENVFIRNPAKGGVAAGGANLFPRQWSAIAQMSSGQALSKNYLEYAMSDVWEDSRMLRRFGNLYHSLPAVALKRILKQVGLIAHDESVWPMASQQKSCLGEAWLRDLNKLLSAYDLI
jgi:dihydrodipicolinate synthase/N-acetylneuraminate lyase